VADESLLKQFLGSVDFELDEFQERSIELLDSGESVLVAAPTGSGKTLVGLYGIFKALFEKKRSFYTTPLKALSNQKYLEFCSYFGTEQVGLLTGDNSIRPEAPVVVMTTEVLRNMIYADNHDLSKVGLVVLDEVHYLQNPYRGAVWEEVIIHLPPTVSLVCLSATVSNAEEFAHWMKTVRGSMEAVIEETRPVELRHRYILGSKKTNSLYAIDTFIDGRANPEGAHYDAPWLSEAPFKRGARPKAFQPKRSAVISLLSEEDRLPVIYFIFSRAGCDEAVREVLNRGLVLTTAFEREEIRKVVDTHLARLNYEDLEALHFEEFVASLEAGVAAHHAGMVPPFREVVEACFERALIKVVFATETLSLGINMPARSVVIEKLTKFNGERHVLLSGGEYTQLAGRAGRRGIDEVGFAHVLWNPSTTFAQAASLAQTRSYPIRSSFRPTYNMASNLVKRYLPDTARHLLNLSFAQYSTDSEVVELEAELSRTKRRLSSVKDSITCDFGDVLAYLEAKETEKKVARQRGDGRTKQPKSDLELHRVKVGTVLSAPSAKDASKRVRLAVVAVGLRSKNRVKLTLVSTSSKAYKVGALQSSHLASVGRIDLPTPYDPSSKEFRWRVSDLLRNLPLEGTDSGEPSFSESSLDSARPDGDDFAEPLNLFSACRHYEEHVAAYKRMVRFQNRVRDTENKIKSKIESLALQLNRVMQILQHFGYVEGWSLTERGERLSRIYSEADLLCSMALEEGLFDGIGAPSMAALVSAFTYESKPNYRDILELPTKEVSFRFSKVLQLWRDLVDQEAALRLPLTKTPEGGFATVLFRWANGADIGAALKGTGLPPGDFVRNVKQTVDLLRQIGEVATNNDTAQIASEAVELCMRGVVALSSQVFVADSLEEEVV